MKVIRRGTGQEETPKQTTCEYCGSILEFMPKEVTHLGRTSLHGITVASPVVLCPVCNKNTSADNGPPF